MNNISFKNPHFTQKQTKTDLWHKVVEFLFPAFCLGCKKDGAYACYDCLQAVVPFSAQMCPLCSKKNSDGSICHFCPQKNFFLDAVYAVGPLHQNITLQKWIHAFKYDFVEDLATPLGDLLFELFEKFHFKDFSLCAVPLHPQRLRFRGFNQSILLLERLQQRYLEKYGTLLAAEHFLQRTSFEKPQMELSREERLLNVENVFMIEPNFATQLSQLKILLIDDVATTLATLNYCAKALKLAGASNVSALTLARA